MGGKCKNLNRNKAMSTEKLTVFSKIIKWNYIGLKKTVVNKFRQLGAAFPFLENPCTNSQV